MNTDLRRSRRYMDFIAVSFLARGEVNGNREAGPFAGRIVNISRHGACLLMPIGAIESQDLYRSTCNEGSLHLEIQGSLTPGMDKFLLAARAIWMDPFILDDIQAFKMGVDFISGTGTVSMHELIGSLTAEQSANNFENQDG